MSSKPAPALPPRPPSGSSSSNSPTTSHARASPSPPPLQPQILSPQSTTSSLSPSTAPSTTPPPFPLPPGFTLPAYFHFPPFFTLQPNAATRAKQVKLWVDLLVSYTQSCTNPAYTPPPPTTAALSASSLPASVRPAPSSRCLVLSVSAPSCVLFSHPRLNRILSTAAITAILAATTAADHCCTSAANTLVYVSPRTLAEWAEAVYGWATEAGAGGAVGGVYTLYELQCGVASSGAVFYGLPLDVLFAAVQRLAQQGRCALIKGDIISETGIKFR